MPRARRGHFDHGDKVKLPALLKGRLLRRYKRFLADIELNGGEIVVAHCPNPGSMRSMNVPGSEVWISRANNPKRKLAYTWELVVSEGTMVLVNTQRANAVVEEALRAGVVGELAGYTGVEREVPYGVESSRVDFVLREGERSCFVEVKSATMFDGPSRAAFPDSVSARGTKHLRELLAVAQGGQRAVLLFCCSREGVETIRPAEEIDPLYAKTLREAARGGVEILAYGCDVSREEIVMRRRLAVMLEE